jgi:hypothetical protein
MTDGTTAALGISAIVVAWLTWGIWDHFAHRQQKRDQLIQPPLTPKEELQAILSGEDEETDIGDIIFDEDGQVMPEYVQPLKELGIKIRITNTSDGHVSTGDDGICRTGPGATFWYD